MRKTRAMISADQALIDVWNRTAAAYVQNAPMYITYREYTRASAASLGRSQEIDRYVAVRQPDDFAVMRDLPSGGERIGKAFPIVPYFNPMSQWAYQWSANLKNVDINLTRYRVFAIQAPQADPSATMSVTYFSEWDVSYGPQSGSGQVHLRVMPVPNSNYPLYFPDIAIDPATQLPSHIELKFANDPEDLQLDYRVLQGHWVLTHATYTGPQHVGPFSFTVVSDTRYEDMAFPAQAPDPRLAGTPRPTPTPPQS